MSEDYDTQFTDQQLLILEKALKTGEGRTVTAEEVAVLADHVHALEMGHAIATLILAGSLDVQLQANGEYRYRANGKVPT